MRARVTLVREPRDRTLPPGLIVPVPRSRGRRIVSYHAVIRTPHDVALARRLGLPVHLVHPELTAAFGHESDFPPVLVVWGGIREAVDTSLAVQEFVSRDASMEPTIEDLVVVMLRIDPFAARGIALRNESILDPVHLGRRVVEEGVAREATLVRLQQVCRAIPKVGTPLSTAVLARQDRNSLTMGLL